MPFHNRLWRPVRQKRLLVWLVRKQLGRLLRVRGSLVVQENNEDTAVHQHPQTNALNTTESAAQFGPS
jgi:hypothetical protein